MNALFSSLLLTTALVVGQHASATTCPTDSTEVRNKRKMESKGNWSGLSFSTLSMAQFQGNLENYTATWGAREDLGLITDDAFDSFRLSINPFERRQKLLSEFLGITTGIGFDWIRLGVAPDRVLGFDASSETVVATVLEPNSVDVIVNRINAVYLRVPVLASVHLFRSGGSGLHAEGGFVAGYLLHGKYNREFQSGTTDTVTEEDFPVAPLQLSARIGVGFGKVSLLGEAALLPFFDENPADSPSMHSFSVGIQVALSD